MRKQVATRRRGEALEEAILDAAWDELSEHGLAGFTLEGAANRAGTSRPVLARRWPERRDLLVATLRDRLEREPISVPDTGSLRSDLISVLTELSARRSKLIALVLSPGFIEGQSGDGDLDELRREVLQNRANPLDAILARAIARAEVDPAKLTKRVRALPLDLLRHEVMMASRPVPRTVIGEIVDQVFLPLVAAKAPTRTGP